MSLPCLRIFYPSCCRSGFCEATANGTHQICEARADARGKLERRLQMPAGLAHERVESISEPKHFLRVSSVRGPDMSYRWRWRQSLNSATTCSKHPALFKWKAASAGAKVKVPANASR